MAKHLQQTQRGLSLDQAKQSYAALNTSQRADLLSAYVQSEALFREAKKIGLDQNDHELKRRMVQRMQILLEGVETSEPPSRDELGAYFMANKQTYRIPATFSFKHVFFQLNETNPALARAEHALAESSGTEFSVQTDRFPYHKAYLDRSAAQIGAHFGTDFVRQLSNLTAQPGVWQGPVKSEYGFHLVNLTSKYDAREPTMDEILVKLRKDYHRAANATQRQVAIAKLVEKYQVHAPELIN